MVSCEQLTPEEYEAMQDLQELNQTYQESTSEDERLKALTMLLRAYIVHVGLILRIPLWESGIRARLEEEYAAAKEFCACYEEAMEEPDEHESWLQCALSQYAAHKKIEALVEAWMVCTRDVTLQ